MDLSEALPISETITRLSSPHEEKQDTPEEPTEIDLEQLKEKGMKEVENEKRRDEERMRKEIKSQKKYGKVSESFVRKSKEFVEFTKTPMCDQMIMASIYYVSSSMALTIGPELDDDERAEQEEIQTDSYQILSSLYCQLLMSPISSNLPVRTERIFYETLIFYLDACITFAIHTAPPEMIIELMGNVFRGGIKDPQSQTQVEFLPITEIVKKHWLSQRVPGKNRATIKHSTLRGNTKLVESLVETTQDYSKFNPKDRAVPVKQQKKWDNDGFPIETRVPFREKKIPINHLVVIPQPKPTSEPISTVVTREGTPRKAEGQ